MCVALNGRAAAVAFAVYVAAAAAAQEFPLLFVMHLRCLSHIMLQLRPTEHSTVVSLSKQGACFFQSLDEGGGTALGIPREQLLIRCMIDFRTNKLRISPSESIEPCGMQGVECLLECLSKGWSTATGNPREYLLMFVMHVLHLWDILLRIRTREPVVSHGMHGVERLLQTLREG